MQLFSDQDALFMVIPYSLSMRSWLVNYSKFSALQNVMFEAAIGRESFIFCSQVPVFDLW